MIHASITSRNAPTPLNLAQLVIERINPLPWTIRRLPVWWWLPGQTTFGGGMKFVQNITRADWKGAEDQKYASSGSGLIPYIGTEDIPGAPGIRTEISKYERSPVIGLDNAAAKPPGSPTEIAAQMILASSSRKQIAIEANARRDWILRLIEKHGPRVMIIAEHTTWNHGGPGTPRLGLEEAQALGADTAVLIAKPPDDVPPAQVPDYRFQTALEWKDRSDLVVRMTGMSQSQMDSLGAFNFAEVA